MMTRLALLARAASTVSAIFVLTAVTLGQQTELEPGFTFRVYDIGHAMTRLHDLVPEQTPNLDERREILDFPAEGGFGRFANQFVVEVIGLLKIDDAGMYEFELTSDDGSYLRIDGEEIVRHDGTHPATSKTGSAELGSGLHPFRIQMFENGGGEALKLEWKTPGSAAFERIPVSAFRIEKGITRVVSPGHKRIMDGHRPTRPGDGAPLIGVHPSWSLEEIRPEGFEPQVGGMDFLPDGRLVLSSFKPVNNGVFREAPNGTIWAVAGLLNGGPVTATQIADGFHDPAGLTVVDGDIYIAHRTDITRLSDEDGDGTFETREVFASDWISDNYHHFTFGLLHH
ncbi:MAG: PA14 domain-containing protein, partial [Planctomycetota bacterium]